MPDLIPDGLPPTLGFPFTPADPGEWSAPRVQMILDARSGVTAASFTGSVAPTPQTNALLLAQVHFRNDAPATVTLSLWGLTWTTIARQPFDAGDVQFLLQATTPQGPISGGGSFTITPGSGSPQAYSLTVFQFLGADSTYIPTLRQWATANRDTSSTPTAVFANPPETTSALVAFLASDDATTVVQPAGFIETVDLSAGANQYEAAYRYDGTVSQTVAWGGAKANYGVFIAEVRMIPAPAQEPVSRPNEPMGIFPPSLLFPSQAPGDVTGAAPPPDDGYIAGTEPPPVFIFDQSDDYDEQAYPDGADEAVTAGPDVPETWAAFDVPQFPETPDETWVWDQHHPNDIEGQIAGPDVVETWAAFDVPQFPEDPDLTWVWDQTSANDGAAEALIAGPAVTLDDGYIAMTESPDQIAWPEDEPLYQSPVDGADEAVLAGPDVPETWAAFDAPQFPETPDETWVWDQAPQDGTEAFIAGPPNFAPDEVMAAQLDPPQDIAALFPDPDPTNDQPFLDFCEAQIAGPDIVETWAAFDVPDQRFDEEPWHSYEAFFNDGTAEFLAIPAVISPEVFAATDPIPQDPIHFPDAEVDWNTNDLDLNGYLFPPPVVVSAGDGGRSNMQPERKNKHRPIGGRANIRKPISLRANRR